MLVILSSLMLVCFLFQVFFLFLSVLLRAFGFLEIGILVFSICLLISALLFVLFGLIDCVDNSSRFLGLPPELWQLVSNLFQAHMKLFQIKLLKIMKRIFLNPLDIYPKTLIDDLLKVTIKPIIHLADPVLPKHLQLLNACEVLLR